MPQTHTALPLGIIEKYNIPVPRYTSYPPANLFSPAYQASQLVEDIERSNREGSRDLSFYIHIPFCRRLCSYCACNKELFPSQLQEIDRYVDYVLRELELLKPLIDPTRRISQVHFGGGSPTAIPLDLIERILIAITSAFALREDAEIAIECHPGNLDHEAWGHLLRMPFTRYSVGVQDMDTSVLRAVKRTPSQLPIGEIIAMIHAAGKRVNLDFIYGLPGQTPESFAAGVAQAMEARPDRLVTFSYAHVPWIHKAQLALEAQGLPSFEEKKAMYDAVTTLARSRGYQMIGMDHFVLPDDPLAKAERQHLLHRNFQGYCPRNLSGQVYALGVTGITQLEHSYAQNLKNIPDYYSAIDRGELPIYVGYRLSREERWSRDVIQDLMCNYRTVPLQIARYHGYQASTLQDLPYFRYAYLEEMLSDGLCRIEGEELLVNTEAQLFVRNVASLFDQHYTPDKPQGYSQPI